MGCGTRCAPTSCPPHSGWRCHSFPSLLPPPHQALSHAETQNCTASGQQHGRGSAGAIGCALFHRRPWAQRSGSPPHRTFLQSSAALHAAGLQALRAQPWACTDSCGGRQLRQFIVYVVVLVHSSRWWARRAEQSSAPPPPSCSSRVRRSVSIVTLMLRSGGGRGAPSGHPHLLHHHVWARGRRVRLGAPPAGAAVAAGRHRRHHRVRAAALRAYAGAHLPQRWATSNKNSKRMKANLPMQSSSCILPPISSLDSSPITSDGWIALATVVARAAPFPPKGWWQTGYGGGQAQCRVTGSCTRHNSLPWPCCCFLCLVLSISNFMLAGTLQMLCLVPRFVAFLSCFLLGSEYSGIRQPVSNQIGTSN